ncbi:hypothetical protein LTR04_001606 [Oleoguttula sp. CCFEE 6159]|nr:hypothetical protein LTR04_001606 [Oleoguttula sp. CCFEE 6159]
MSFSQSFTSSPLSLTPQRRKSKFTFKHLSQLAASSTACPLRVIAHIDLDAFYAQCEMVRLGLPEDQPLAVQQWQGLIAINYPARKFGLNRHITITEAQKLCPKLICQHVATWKEGDEKWAYNEDAFKEMATRKVSLDPYRTESRKILALVKETLPAVPLQKVEKASIDEVFVDLSAQIHSILLKRYPELDGPPPYDDPTENLPRPSNTALNWDTDALVDLDASETEDDDPDWDDITMLIGSEIVRSVRLAVREKLKYTCSAGVAKNKMLAKLGSGHKKPNAQTIIRNRAVQQFMSGFKFTKIRNLGGKLGDQVVAAFNTDTVQELLEVPLEQLKKRMGDDTGGWLYNVIRGEDYSEVNPRTEIKSMLSAKSFRPTINEFEVGVRWLRIFVADIFSRLVEEGVLENKRRPKTINLHHRQGMQTRSKQAPIPQGKAMSEEMLFELSKTLLAQVVVDGKAWPCANLSLSVGGFEDGITGNKGIGGFLVRGEEAKAMLSNSSEVDYHGAEPPEKRRKIDDGGSNKFLLAREESSRGDSEQEFVGDLGVIEPHVDDPSIPPPSGQRSPPTVDDSENVAAATGLPRSLGIEEVTPLHSAKPNTTLLDQQSIETYLCKRCDAHVPVTEQSEHEDYHFAKDLQNEDRNSSTALRATQSTARPAPPRRGRGRGRPPGSGMVRAEKGQKRLAFG